MSHNGNGENNGESDSGGVGLFGDSLPFPDRCFEDADRVRSEISDLSQEIRRLASELASTRKVVAEIRAMLKSLNDECAAITELIKRGLIPLAEENRGFHNHEIEEKFLGPVIVGLAHILDRQSGEISEAERHSQAISFVESCRAIDNAEIVELLATVDVEAVRSFPGSKLDGTIHRVIRTQRTTNPTKVGRITKVLRPGYRRRSDGYVFRPMLVEVWVAAMQEFNP
jgi:molecular chaperone GrpE (heat shock protein)